MKQNNSKSSFFQMPLHYPRYTKEDYESMPEWQLDRLLAQYGLPNMGDLPRKREFAMGTFLWPDVVAKIAKSSVESADASKKTMAGH
ncbi:hypothetical protein MRB53_032722 [Persea americana]|uniref:Uncharacterized protein n=1 Tax=Persea americana TaxID=3435 RepID=A0ACC2KSP8_PERAE|nr:hypothetical protein MRB53_032722 [Persea americana]